MIGKCNTGGGENLTTQLNNQDAIITELEAKVQSVSGVDMATPVNAQTLTIEDIQEALVDKGAVDKVELTVTPGKDSQEYNPDYGTLYSKVTINGDADLTAENIREGIDIFGVVGTMSEGLTGVDYGTITLSAAEQNITVSHSLNVKPRYVFLIRESIYAIDSFGAQTTSVITNDSCLYCNTTANLVHGTYVTKTNATIQFKGYGSNTLKGTYHWFAIA